MKIQKIVIAIAIFVLSACTTPPLPKQPDESNRVPINKTVPAEIGEAVQ